MNLIIKATLVLISAYIASNYLFNHSPKDNADRKNVLITGASQNIGEEIAYNYARRNANICLTSRTEHKLQVVAKNCKNMGANDASYHTFDMNNWNDADILLSKAIGSLGGLDILVLNHVYGKHSLWDNSSESLQYMQDAMNINYYSYVAIATAALPILQKNNGQIIIISSAAGKGGMANMGAYGASKAALSNFFESLQAELHSKNGNNVHITIVTLGAIQTKSTRWGGHVPIKGHPMKKAVESIVSGTNYKHSSIFAPWWIKHFVTMKYVAPSFVTNVMEFLKR